MINSNYIDIHAHLTHPKFAQDVDRVIQNAAIAGVSHIVVNGLEPVSNRQVIALAEKYHIVKPALGIYPIDAVNAQVQGQLPFEVAEFDVDEEIEFIRIQAKAGAICAIGECGLDGYWVGDETFAEQERVFLALAEVAVDNDLPLIIHTRKLEARSMEILRYHKIERVNFHCYGSKVKMALKAANEDGWWFSIPANARKDGAFTKMLKELPTEKILTETDCPYLAPERGQRSEPKDVVTTVSYLAELRGWDEEEAKQMVWNNFVTFMADNPGVNF